MEDFMQEIIGKVKKVLASVLKMDSPETLEEDANLRDDLGLDSMLSLTFLIKC
jgi:acyl carrier protein